MRIALAHPLYWPEVRRGSERVVHDLGEALARRGHEVTLLTTHPGRLSERHEEGVRVRRRRRPPPVPGLGLYELYLETLPGLVRDLRRLPFDVVHAFHLASAFGAVEARRFGGPPVVYSFHGIPTRTYLVVRRRRVWMLERVLAGAAVTTALSESAARPFRRYLGFEPEIVPAGVDMHAFAPGEREPRPTIVCASAFTDPRKRVPLLLEAFGRLRSRVPESRLLLTDVPGGGPRPALPEGAEWLPADTGLGEAYARAWVTALPSVEEAQGLVLLESLAAGTPVVAGRSGFPPEVLEGKPGAGRLFEPDDAIDLARALEEALELAGLRETAGTCRDLARAYSWDALLDRHEDLYGKALEADGAAGAPAARDRP
jgi:glycosyltransferase involved in cell wall biosynthesis